MDLLHQKNLPEKMKINNISNHLYIPPVVNKSVTEYIEQKQEIQVEVKVALQKIEQEMVELKTLISQIAAIRCNKDVS